MARPKDSGWDGQWNGHHGGRGRGEDYDYDEYDEDLIANDWGDGMVGDLQVTDPRGRIEDSDANFMSGFTKASSLLKSSSTKKSSINSLLNKYEVRVLCHDCVIVVCVMVVCLWFFFLTSVVCCLPSHYM